MNQFIPTNKQMDHDDPLLPSNLSKKYNEFIYEKSAWKVGNALFANKIDAMLETDKSSNKIEFIVDPRWATVDFSKRPETSFFNLCVERAAQIRRDYDYIRLAIGAGWDTNTVLESFRRAGAKIDEIVINRKFIKSPNDLCCYEETHVTPHILEHYKDFLKNTKVTIIDTDGEKFNKFYSNPNFLRYHFSTQLDFHSGMSGYNPYYHAPQLLDKFDQGIRSVYIMGTEKVRLLSALGDELVAFIDRDFKVLCPGHLDFFRDACMPELSIAEAHLLLEQKQQKIPLEEAVKAIRFPIPEKAWNDMVHKHPSKYFSPRSNQENNKAVAMAMEASLHPETKHLQQAWIDGIQCWADQYPQWFTKDWISAKWIKYSSSYCFSLTSPTVYQGEDLAKEHALKFPNTPLKAHVHIA
jgi:hypothetical protein